ncbi:MAG: histidine kinase [Acidobacteriota bacterium]
MPLPRCIAWFAQPRPRQALLGLSGWTAFGVLLSLLVSAVDRRANSFVDLLLFVVPTWWLWWLISPVVFWLGRRYPPIGQGWYRRLPLHVVTGVLAALLVGVFASAWLLVAYPYPEDVSPNATFADIYRLYLVTAEFPSHVFVYGLLVAGSSAFAYYHTARERERRELELQAELGRAKLRALEMQLRPHFLFNTLNAVVGLVLRKELAAAVAMLNGLADLLRLTLEDDGRQEIPLRRELAFVEKYLAIEKVRFPDRLDWRVEAEPEALDALVPNLLLQPLVENSVRYAVDSSAGGGCLRFRAACRGGQLVLCLVDDGPGLDPRGASSGLGIGLTNVRERLQHLYGEAHTFRLENRPDGGLEATLELPWRQDDETEPESVVVELPTRERPLAEVTE